VGSGDTVPDVESRDAEAFLAAARIAGDLAAIAPAPDPVSAR
jgi:hypothetical protein